MKQTVKFNMKRKVQPTRQTVLRAILITKIKFPEYYFQLYSFTL